MRFYEQIKLERGELLYRPPYGYEMFVNKEGDKDVRLVPTDASKVILLFELYSTDGYSLNQLLDEVENITGKRLTRSHIASTLRNKFYIGLMSYRGELFAHKYPHIITEEKFKKVELIMNGRTSRGVPNSSYKGKRFKFSDTFLCGECGNTLRGFYVNGNIYYRCNQSMKQHNATAIQEKKIVELLLKKVRELS